MSIRHFLRFTVLATFSILAWLPVSSSAHNHLRAEFSGRPDVFPYPHGLRDAVEFWRQVFGVWPRNQVVLHDNEYLGAIYEIVHLPAPWSDGLTTAQARLIEARRQSLELRLRAVEHRLRHDLPLDAGQQRLHDSLVTAAGKYAVYGAAQRVRHQRGMRERFLEGLQTSGRYDSHIREVFRDARLPEDLAYLPHIESSFVNHSRSNVGAAGTWQFMRSTGKLYLMINDAVDERYDPILAARGAARYLGGAYQRLGDWGLAITSYNHGINGMAAARQQYGADIGKIVRDYKSRLFGFASRNFYAEFLAVRSIINDLQRYFPGGVRFDAPVDYARVRLVYPATLTQFASHYRVGAGLVRILNPALTPHAASGRISLPAGTEIWLPKHTVADARTLTYYTLRQDTVLREKPMVKKPGVAEARKPVAAKSVRKKSVTKTNSRRSRTHVVRKGESAYRIANRYGVPVHTMMVLNDLRPNAIIRPGQQLRIPAK